MSSLTVEEGEEGELSHAFLMYVKPSHDGVSIPVLAPLLSLPSLSASNAHPLLCLPLHFYKLNTGQQRLAAAAECPPTAVAASADIQAKLSPQPQLCCPPPSSSLSIPLFLPLM